jgi:hypothetical protein
MPVETRSNFRTPSKNAAKSRRSSSTPRVSASDRRSERRIRCEHGLFSASKPCNSSHGYEDPDNIRSDNNEFKPTIEKCCINDVFTDFIPTYFLGVKAFLKKGPIYTALGMAGAIYLGLVWWKVILFLDVYYLEGRYKDDIAKLKYSYRCFIAASYLLIDAIYPISLVLLYRFYKSGSHN